MKTYKKFTLSFLLVAPLIWLLYFVSIYLFYFDNKHDSFSVNTYFKYKENLAKSIDSKKVVFTSGSNTFLGIRTIGVEKHFGIPTVNMAVHAGLGTTYILDRVKKVLNKGDIVIVPLEYSNFIKNGEQSIVKNKYLLSYDKEYFLNSLAFSDKLKCISSISVFDLVVSILDGSKETKGKKDKVELLKDLNKNADMLNKTEHDPFKTSRPLFQLPTPYNVETKALTAIKEFNTWCKEREITFYITYPNTIYRKAYETKRYADYFNFLEEFFRKNNIEFIGKPLEMMYAKKYFYDTQYHLISEGSDIRTKDFIEVLEKENRIPKR
jgi:hypothetical protein